MSDGRALLAAICANPDEDTPRLAYADWLDENVGAMPKDRRESVRMRAELIRVQCELAAMSPEEDDADTATRRVELELREEALLKNASRRRSWERPLRDPIPDRPDLRANEHVFLRGFPLFSRNAATESYLAAGEAFFDLQPVHSLRCWGVHGEVADRFFTQPWLSRIRRLTISTSPYGAGAHLRDAATSERLFAHPGLTNLELLDLANWEFRAPGQPVVDRTLANLRVLNFCSGVWTGPATFERLGELLPADVPLRDLYLSTESPSAGDVRAALLLPQFRSLERLAFNDLHNGRWYSDTSPLGAEGVRAIADSPCWATLRALSDGDQKRLRDREIEALAACPPAPNLRSLVIPSGMLGVANGPIAALAQSPLLASVTALDVSRTKVGDAGVIALAKSPYLGRLVNLNLSHTDVGPKGLKALAASALAPNLVRLNVDGCPIRKGGIDALVSAAFPRLKKVDAVWAAKIASQKQRLKARFGDGVRV